MRVASALMQAAAAIAHHSREAHGLVGTAASPSSAVLHSAWRSVEHVAGLGCMPWPRRRLSSSAADAASSTASVTAKAAPGDSPPAAAPADTSPSEQLGSMQREQKKKEYYSTTPLILDANSTVPLKSSEYASSHDDSFGVQKNWFTALYKQLNYFAKTGTVTTLNGRQKQVFEAVEREFEGLYDKYIKAAGLQGMEHRAMLMIMLSIATYRILNDEIADQQLVRDVIRTNQGSLMMAVLLPLHRFRINILRYLLAEEPYKQAVQFLPALQQDMGGLCESQVWPGAVPAEPGPADIAAAAAAAAGDGRRSSSTLPDEVSLVVTKCKYHEVLTKEDAPFLLSEFCCHHGMTWLNEFKKHGVEVGLERSKVWEDSCCQIRVSRPTKAGQQQPTG